ncbi:hypothetical protein F7734_18885 [Scytonema sp. UIC 10036]|nr:hypothetical protein [Scytonema sp. UIC 10036]
MFLKLSSLGLNVPIAVVLDNARAQKCNLVQGYAKELGIALYYLPSYSLQLNLIERFGKFIRKECLYSKYYEHFSDFKAAISNCIHTANTEQQSKLNRLLNLKFQSFKKVQIFTC